jgi:outer membrane phospholipase A
LSYDKANFDANLGYSYAGDRVLQNGGQYNQIERFWYSDLNLGYTFDIPVQVTETLRLGLQVSTF